MSEENNNPPDDSPPAEPAVAPAAEPTFTQEQVNALMAKTKAQARRQAKKEFEAMTAPVQTQETPASTGQGDEPPAWAKAMMERDARRDAREAARESEQNFAASVAGLEMDADTRETFKTLFENNHDLFSRQVASLRAKDQPPAPTGEFAGLAAPNPVPNLERATDPLSWTSEDIAVMRKDGTFLKRVQAHANSLPGGGGGLFPAKTPGKGRG